ncbi:F-box/kelch-repeat protein At1g64840-like [Telopea speciosissima]|uniref:F-box/kelch-repeat protein At1g64840-like n=1 Tax=Telopea speciosissima TaxID=54955 RepID=UPI001CC47E6B|nr:F-box/kelch-repeat protein At1g64840-like [Telopea speciosissima]
MYFNGLLYVLRRNGGIVAWDVNDLPLNEATQVAPPFGVFLLRAPQPTAYWFSRKWYLVESSGDLLQVLLWFREMWERRNTFDSASCSVCRLDQSSRTWVEVESLPGRVLFLGHNSAISLSARDFPEFRENSVYFGEYFWEGWLEGEANVGHQNLGVFNLEERRFVRYSSCALQRIKPPLVWVVPNFR